MTAYGYIMEGGAFLVVAFDEIYVACLALVRIRILSDHKVVRVQVYKGWNNVHLYSSITDPSKLCAP